MTALRTQPHHPPEDLLQHPGHLLRRALQAMNLIWNQDVSHTITSPQFAALNALHREPNIDQRTLGEQISLDRSTTAEVVGRLTARGFRISVLISLLVSEGTRRPYLRATAVWVSNLLTVLATRRAESWSEFFMLS